MTHRNIISLEVGRMFCFNIQIFQKSGKRIRLFNTHKHQIQNIKTEHEFRYIAINIINYQIMSIVDRKKTDV